jgi:hypothetical protein
VTDRGCGRVSGVRRKYKKTPQFCGVFLSGEQIAGGFVKATLELRIPHIFVSGVVNDRL